MNELSDLQTLLGTIEQLDDNFEIYSASLRSLYHPQRIETTRYVHCAIRESRCLDLSCS